MARCTWVVTPPLCCKGEQQSGRGRGPLIKGCRGFSEHFLWFYRQGVGVFLVKHVVLQVFWLTGTCLIDRYMFFDWQVHVWLTGTCFLIDRYMFDWQIHVFWLTGTCFWLTGTSVWLTGTSLIDRYDRYKCLIDMWKGRGRFSEIQHVVVVKHVVLVQLVWERGPLHINHKDVGGFGEWQNSQKCGRSVV